MTWVNHASFVLEVGDVALITDPWLEGSAFNHGWSLLSPTVFKYQDFDRITHIWFSHEHPDHFSPPCLSKIPEAIRRKITVLYQDSRDGRVSRFCRELGFRVEELADGESKALSDRFRVTLGKHRGGDSWMHFLADGRSVLNVNDCVIATRDDASTIQETIRRAGSRDIDVLLTQFSYANWEGNRDDRARRRRSAREKLDRVRTQVAVLQPKVVIPFASFVEFTHAENTHMNADANRVGSVVSFLRNLGVRPVVLYPGDCWELDDQDNTERAVARYEEDYARIGVRPRTSSPEVPLSTLCDEAGKAVESIARNNGGQALVALLDILYLRGTSVYVRDLETSVEFRVSRGIRATDTPREACDIEMSADSLLYCCKFLWGAGTLAINGRYEELRPGSRDRFFRNFTLMQRNAFGDFFPKDYLRAEAIVPRLKHHVGHLLDTMRDHQPG